MNKLFKCMNKLFISLNKLFRDALKLLPGTQNKTFSRPYKQASTGRVLTVVFH